MASASRLTSVALGVGLVAEVGAEDRGLVRVGHRPGEAVGVGVGAVADGDHDCGVPAELDESVPLMTPVLALMRDAAGQAGGGVGQAVEVGIGRVGVEADERRPRRRSGR